MSKEQSYIIRLFAIESRYFLVRWEDCVLSDLRHRKRNSLGKLLRISSPQMYFERQY